MRKKILTAIMIIMAAISLTACGGGDPMIVQETQTGLNLEDKARELTGQEGEKNENADQTMEAPAE